MPVSEVDDVQCSPMLAAQLSGQVLVDGLDLVVQSYPPFHFPNLMRGATDQTLFVELTRRQRLLGR